MNRITLPRVITVLTAAWLLVQIGVFVQARVPWGQDALFWPLWISWAVVLLLSVLLIQVRTTNRPRP